MSDNIAVITRAADRVAHTLTRRGGSVTTSTDDRWCAACATTHPRSAFGPYARAADGLQSYCRESERRRLAAYRSTERGRRANVESSLKAYRARRARDTSGTAAIA